MTAGVRRAVAADMPALEIVRRQAVEADYADAYDRASVADLVATPEHTLPDWVAAADHRVLVAETEATIVGFGAVSVASGRLLALYTAPDYRREGVASDLLERLESACGAAGCDAVVAAIPTTAWPFFAARGFTREEEHVDEGIPMLDIRKAVQPDA